MVRAERKARENVDKRAAGRPEARGRQEEMVPGRGVFARGRAEGLHHGKRHR